MGRKLTERALLVEMVRITGPAMTTSLLGVAAAAAMLGVTTREGFLSMPFGSVPSRYRWWHAFAALREGLEAAGYDVAPDDMPVVAATVFAVTRP